MMTSGDCNLVKRLLGAGVFSPPLTLVASCNGDGSGSGPQSSGAYLGVHNGRTELGAYSLGFAVSNDPLVGWRQLDAHSPFRGRFEGDRSHPQKPSNIALPGGRFRVFAQRLNPAQGVWHVLGRCFDQHSGLTSSGIEFTCRASGKGLDRREWHRFVEPPFGIPQADSDDWNSNSIESPSAIAISASP